ATTRASSSACSRGPPGSAVRRSGIRTLGLVLVTLAGLAGCGDDNSDSSATQATPMTCPAAETQTANAFDANELVGLTSVAAEQKAKSHGCSVRATKQDGKELP